MILNEQTYLGFAIDRRHFNRSLHRKLTFLADTIYTQARQEEYLFQKYSQSVQVWQTWVLFVFCFSLPIHLFKPKQRQHIRRQPTIRRFDLVFVLISNLIIHTLLCFIKGNLSSIRVRIRRRYSICNNRSIHRDCNLVNAIHNYKSIHASSWQYDEQCRTSIKWYYSASCIISSWWWARTSIDDVNTIQIKLVICWQYTSFDAYLKCQFEICRRN